LEEAQTIGIIRKHILSEKKENVFPLPNKYPISLRLHFNIVFAYAVQNVSKVSTSSLKIAITFQRRC
jgi:hypothetical protein